MLWKEGIGTQTILRSFILTLNIIFVEILGRRRGKKKKVLEDIKALEILSSLYHMWTWITAIKTVEINKTNNVRGKKKRENQLKANFFSSSFSLSFTFPFLSFFSFPFEINKSSIVLLTEKGFHTGAHAHTQRINQNR